MYNKFGYAILLLALSLNAYCEKEKKQEHFNIVLLGATGDLATRYLWSGKNSVTKMYLK